MNRSYSYCLLLLLFLVIHCPFSFGQNIDFFAEIDMDEHPNLCPGKIFGDSTTSSGPKGTWSMGTYGPATVYENAKVWYVNSMSRFLTQQEKDSLGAGPNSFWMQQALIQENIEAPDYLSRESGRPVNDIGILLDWDLYENSDSIRYLPPPYETDKAYGFFVHIVGMGAGPDEIVNTDNNPGNNWAVKKVVWGCNAVVSVPELLKSKNTIRLYPNPAADQVQLDYTAAAPATLRLTIRALTGNIVLSRQEPVAAGIQHLSIDIAGLNNGLYLLELNDGRAYSSGKFVVRH